MRAVAEVRAGLGAGLYGVTNLRPGRGRVADGNDYASRRKFLNERNRPGAFWRDRDHANVPAGRHLPAPKLVPVRVADELFRVSASRAVVARQVWPFEVITGDKTSQLRVCGAGVLQCRKAVLNRLETVRDESRKKSADAVLATGVRDS